MILMYFQCLLLHITPWIAAHPYHNGSPTLLMYPSDTAQSDTDTDCHIRWLTPMNHHFGTIAQGKPVQIVFRFQNEGTQPVLLETVRSTCGCTAAKWTETAIEPGAEGEISIEYDAYRRGKFHKKIWVFFDCQKKPYFLHIEGKCKPSIR